MPFVLILSSHVAASRVGGMAQLLALQPFKIDAALVPTVLFGRHPGWGAPGGGPVDASTMRAMLEGIEAQGLFALTDALITGYFANAEQVEVAAAFIGRVRAARPDVRIVVDPILGDEDSATRAAGLYVKPEVAAAVRDRLVPLADLITPNRFELGWLVGKPTPGGAEATLLMARALGRPALVSSIPGETDEIGVLYADADQAWLALHARLFETPNGTGDVLTALFTAALIEGQPPQTALIRSVGEVATLVEAAIAWDAPELPIVAAAERLKSPTAVVRLHLL